MREEQTLAEIEDFIEGFNQSTCRGMRVNGVLVNSHPSTGGRVTAGLMRSGYNRSLKEPTTDALV
jgi:hypothetical protein